ncbi:tRNA 2-thiouridine(34) synthase MnmA [candidate division KSB1 bacterium]|nr:MAG: tRNA 2-thiouridine(34) synthase MnmA [candidate division KSB1 bacterium]
MNSLEEILKASPSENAGKTVAVAMSGGVDSSVAAALLKLQGYDVIGLTMHLWTDPRGEEMDVNHASGCCSFGMARDAAAVAARMGFRHYILDLSREFHDCVVKDFVAEYERGRTPNPCVLCNSRIKWQTLLERASRMGCDYLATGHYARIERKADRFCLLRSLNTEKDQSYALWRLSQESLSRTLLPLGDLTKTDVRKFAAEFGLNVADKQESQDICFIPDNDYRRFLRDHTVQESGSKAQGEIIGTDGRVLGYHEGIASYTVGQRRGLGISASRPLYVTRIDPAANRVYVAYDEDCFSDEAMAEDVNWLSISEPKEAIDCGVKVRYRDSTHEARVCPLAKNRVRIQFAEPVRAVTPGQSAVFYKGDTVLGGGVLSDSRKMEVA